MNARRLASLGVALAAWTAIAAGETGTSYSLNELRAIARSAHPTLASAEAAVQSAQGTLRQARSYPNPELFLAGGRARPADGGDYQSEGAILILQPIELPGVRRWRARSAELQLRGVEVDRLVNEMVIDSAVTQLVYTVLLEQRRAEIARESAEVARRLHELLARHVEIGESSRMEATKARSEWFARRRDVVVAESALGAARSALSLFCGKRLSAIYEIAENLRGPGAIALPAALAERLRAHNPVLLRAGVQIEEAHARTQLARTEVFPRFEVLAAHETELDRTGTSLGFNLTLPLWNRNRGQIAAAASQHVRAGSDAQALVLELETALERASATYRGALAAIRLHQEGWTAAARQSLDIATFSFENGEASLLEVLDAQRSFLGVNLAEAESWALLAFARAEIERLIAGPLEVEDTDEVR